jgi:ferric-dicitrate binding protein FerR (iron transport regulator)
MDLQQLQEILNRFSAGECTPAEKELVDKWYGELVSSGELPWDRAQRNLMEATLENRLLQSITNEPSQALSTGRVRFIQRKFWWAAAVFVLLAGGAYFFFLNNKPKKEIEVAKTKTQPNDVAPGGNKAVLTLANGTTINLDDVSNGMVAQQGNAKVVKSGDGQLVYDAKALTSPERSRMDHSPLSYNTLSTPKGGQYQLVLPDGSKVWLNAASSIRYPTAFTGSERRVEITGEAYFEVSKVLDSRGQNISFAVDILPSTGGTGGGRVEVLGTHFNINAYDDEEAMKTTLLEGKVKVSSAIGNERSAILKPGEQAVQTRAHSRFTIDHSPDLDQVMAWKNGLFHFEHADLKTVMRQLARWYDVDIIYKNPAQKSDPLFIDMSRNANLSDVLKALEVSGSARFSIEGKKIIVL